MFRVSVGRVVCVIWAIAMPAARCAAGMATPNFRPPTPKALSNAPMTNGKLRWELTVAES